MEAIIVSLDRGYGEVMMTLNWSLQYQLSLYASYAIIEERLHIVLVVEDSNGF